MLVLVAGGLAAGYVYVLRQNCSGEARATILASESTAGLLRDLANRWVETGPAVDGTCAKVDVVAADSKATADRLSTEWDTKTAGVAPDVWVPESSAWVGVATAFPEAEPRIPDLQPSVARSPTVIAMPRPMAEAMGWPREKLTWQQLIDTFSNKKSWAQFGKKEWGAFKFGMSDPNTSTAGLLALTAMLDADDDAAVSDEEKRSVGRLQNTMEVYEPSTEKILARFIGDGGQGGDGGPTAVSAFPALEQEIFTHNKAHPDAPLVAIYPTNGNIEADNPYLILNAPWSTGERKRVAQAFLGYVRGPAGQAAMKAAGFRDYSRRPGPELTERNGLAQTLEGLPRAVLVADEVTNTTQEWTALTRPTNLLLVLDVSGSMKAAVPGAGKSRLQLAKEAAARTVRLFDDDAQVGLWVFSTLENGSRDYRQVVSIGRLDDEMDGGSRREIMISRIGALKPNKDTGLYDTTAAAHQAILDNYQKGAKNIVVLMTDGKNDDPPGGLTLNQLTDKLRKTPKDKPVQVVMVAYGSDTDFPVLAQISDLTNAQAFSAQEEFDIDRVLSAAATSS
ncbi:MAG TPA: extracellular solute-binding protein [Micromonosporaceae bacterium]|nr:extracellular solute-binding protein [Micromonosporaceae bacterium]